MRVTTIKLACSNEECDCTWHVKGYALSDGMIELVDDEPVCPECGFDGALVIEVE